MSDAGDDQRTAALRPVPREPGTGHGRGGRPPLFRHPWRVTIVVVALLAVVNLGVILLANADTSVDGRPSLPSDIEAISPERGELVGLVDDISVNLADSYTGVLKVNGQEIPEDQLDRVPELGIITFRPGPGKDITRLRTGDNLVEVLYWPRTKDRPENPAHFGWRFRAAA
jgi:hypothetical protein